jgi:hypothetical protein
MTESENIEEIMSRDLSHVNSVSTSAIEGLIPLIIHFLVDAKVKAI